MSLFAIKIRNSYRTSFTVAATLHVYCLKCQWYQLLNIPVAFNYLGFLLCSSRLQILIVRYTTDYSSIMPENNLYNSKIMLMKCQDIRSKGFSRDKVFKMGILLT